MARKSSRSGSNRRSSYNRSYYETHRKKILQRAARRYKSKRSKILMYQKKYRMRTKAGTSSYKPLYLRGSKKGKRPLYGRLPRLNSYRFIGRKRGKSSKALGRKSSGFRRGGKSNVGRKPKSGGRAFASRK